MHSPLKICMILNGFFVQVDNAAHGQPYWTAKNIDALGRVTEESFGNGATTIKKYDPTDERLQHIDARERGERILDLELGYDPVGNLKTRTEKVDRKRETFEYDEINRLVAWVSVDNGRSEYRYDAAGRITYKAGVGDYHYANRVGVTDSSFGVPFHAVSRTNYGQYEQHYRYDLDGNLISSREGHFDYTSDNHLKLLYLDEQKWMRFDYGPSGDRFRQFSRIGGASEETLYLGLFEKVIDYSLSANFDVLFPDKFSGFERFTRSRNYLVNSSGVFGVVETDDTLANTELFAPHNDPRSHWYGKLSTTETWYIHADQLGSILCVTDQDGRVRERFWYDPWGARTEKQTDQPGRGESQRLVDSWKRGFTGHEHLAAFSLIHMNGRVYSTILAQFLSVDPLNKIWPILRAEVDMHTSATILFAM
jgi:YD repeat-containing protein